MSDTWQHIGEMLSEQNDIIDRLSTEDDDFRDLCRDFDDCVEAMHRWETSPDPTAETKAREYRDLLAALYAEIEQILKERI